MSTQSKQAYLQLCAEIAIAFDAPNVVHWNDEFHGFPKPLQEKLSQPSAAADLWRDCVISGRYIDCAEIPFESDLLELYDAELVGLFGAERASALRSGTKPHYKETFKLEQFAAQELFRQGYVGMQFCICRIPRDDGKSLFVLLMETSTGPSVREVFDFYSSAEDALSYLLNYGYIDRPVLVPLSPGKTSA